ncbi:MAG: hypothetical protein QNJ61_13280, partial [Desulfobacterales bacterium]|nr:hypothetical protein [Desulfobacterales bacterium]
MSIQSYNEVDKVSDSEMRIFGSDTAIPAQGFAVRCTPVRRSRKPAENAEQGQKDHFWTDT